MQIITLTGNIVADAEIRNGKDGNEFVSFRVAANEVRGEEKRTTFYDVVYPKNGLLQYLKKGQKVLVVGRLSIAIATKDGNSFANLNVSASQIELCGAREG